MDLRGFDSLLTDKAIFRYMKIFAFFFRLFAKKVEHVPKVKTTVLFITYIMCTSVIRYKRYPL
ncbi:MAG: hypothetical protein CL607_10545 [Anaerolineaceae bacterium]|nr:hypothetical protein [Anaerolineaceae bacterium]